jgi:hypothetical protein
MRATSIAPTSLSWLRALFSSCSGGSCRRAVTLSQATTSIFERLAIR